MATLQELGMPIAKYGPGMVWFGVGRCSGPEVLLYVSDESKIKRAELGHGSNIDDEVASQAARAMGLIMVKGHVSQYPPTPDDIRRVTGQEQDIVIDLRCA